MNTIITGTENWALLATAHGDAQEFKRVQARKQIDVEGVIKDYFGNTQVLRDGNGRIVELVKYREDHTMQVWKKGVWLEGRWVINNGQDASKVFHTFDVLGKPASWRHAFAPNKKPGDMWINPETANGLPVYNCGIGVHLDGKRLIVDDTDLEAGAYYSMEEGDVQPDDYSGEKFDFLEQNLETVGENYDKAMEGYYGNTFYFRNDAGLIIEAIYYNRDHTHRAWRGGRWTDGRFMLNNGQDNSCLIQSRADMYNKPAGWCHPFAPFKKAGDVWVAPEDHMGGDPAYPLTAAGVPVVTVHGKNMVVGTDMVPREFYRIAPGYVSLEELQSRDF